MNNYFHVLNVHRVNVDDDEKAIFGYFGDVITIADISYELCSRS